MVPLWHQPSPLPIPPPPAPSNRHTLGQKGAQEGPGEKATSTLEDTDIRYLSLQVGLDPKASRFTGDPGDCQLDGVGTASLRQAPGRRPSTVSAPVRFAVWLGRIDACAQGEPGSTASALEAYLV